MMSGAPEVIAATMLAAFVVGLAKGGLANAGVIAAPIMSLVMSPIAAAALLLPVYVLSDLVGVWLYWHIYSGRNLAILLPSAILGVVIGWVVAAGISDVVANLIIGIVGCSFCAVQWWRDRNPPVPREPDLPRGVLLGVLTGLTSFLTHSGAATFQMYVMPQRLDKLTFAGTSAITFAVVNAAKIIPYWQLGQLTETGLHDAAFLVPVGIAGTFAGSWIAKRLPPVFFFGFIQLALLVVSVLQITESIAAVIGG
jgi:uncharacterized protein